MDIVEKARLSQKQEWNKLSGDTSSRLENENEKQQVIKTKWPDTIHPVAYHGIVGDIVKLIEPHSEADPIALLVTFLTAVGSVIGNTAHFKVEADRHPARLFTVLVGESAKSRKGTSWGHVRKVLEVVDPEWSRNVQGGLSSGEGLIFAVRDATTKVNDFGEIEVIEAGVKDKRLLVVESEFASTLKVMSREGNILSGIIRNAWDTGGLQTMTKSSQTRSTDSHISLVGHVTKNELLKYLTNTEASNGFANRFMWFCVKRSKFLPFGGNLDESKLVALTENLAVIINRIKTIEEVVWAEETKLLWKAIYPALSEGKQGLYGSMVARSEANVVRLALLYALLDESRQIQPIHLKAALAVWSYSESSSKYIFGDLTGDETADAIEEALLMSIEGMSRTDISNHFGRHKSSEVIGESLDLLIGMGRVEKIIVPTEGRSREIFRLTNTSRDISSNSLVSQSKYVELVEQYEGA